MKKYIKKIIFILALSLVLAFVMIYIFTQITKPKETIIYKSNITDSSADTAFIQDTLIKKVSEQKKLVCLEVEAEQNIDISKSIWNLDILRQTKNITFYGKGNYTIDLSSITSENILVDDKNKIINLKIDKPSLEQVLIDESKTQMQETENGLFRFGEYKLTPEEYNSLTIQVKEKLTQKMSESEYSQKAQESAKRNIENLISSVLNNMENGQYNIIIDFNNNLEDDENNNITDN